MLKTLIAWITCKALPAKEIAHDDMAEAERMLLKHEASALYHTKMTEYYRETFYRLNHYCKAPN